MKPRLGMLLPLRTEEDLEAAYEKGLLRKEELVHGAYYRGSCRNTEVARWHAGGQAFVHPRRKFGETFLESIRHPADERNYDVFRVVELTTEPAAEQVVEDAWFEPFFERRARPVDDDD